MDSWRAKYELASSNSKRLLEDDEALQVRSARTANFSSGNKIFHTPKKVSVPTVSVGRVFEEGPVEIGIDIVVVPSKTPAFVLIGHFEK